MNIRVKVNTIDGREWESKVQNFTSDEYNNLLESIEQYKIMNYFRIKTESNGGLIKGNVTFQPQHIVAITLLEV
jgi:hypothetical protein